MSNSGDSGDNSTKGSDPRFILAIAVLIFSIAGVVILAGIVLAKDSQLSTTQYDNMASNRKGELMETIEQLAKIFSLLGIPVVTALLGFKIKDILSKRGTEQEYVRLAISILTEKARGVPPELTDWAWDLLSDNAPTPVSSDVLARLKSSRIMIPDPKLESIPVGLMMIPRADMALLKITSSKPLDQIKIVGDILDTLKREKRNRLPILDESDHPKYMIHRSMIDKFLAQKTIEGGLSADALKQLCFKADLLDKDEELRKLFETSFATVREDANLADAKIQMDKRESCLDVFVTKNGTKNEAVIGWLTNLIIVESAKV